MLVYVAKHVVENLEIISYYKGLFYIGTVGKKTSFILNMNSWTFFQAFVL